MVAIMKKHSFWPLTRFALFLLSAMVPGAATAAAKEPLRVGVDANYSLDMERAGAQWTWDGTPTDLFEGMARRGVTEFRVRLWTREDGPHGKAYATAVVQQALQAGLNPYLVLFLSEDWSDMMKQPLPAAWQGLSLDERAEAVRVYSRDVVAHFRRQGLKSHLYEIGNEIDYGLCGEYPGKGTKKNPETLSRGLWPRSARIIRASQAGVREADPEAKFMLHIAHWWDAEFCEAFFRFMLDQGVQLDFAGLSYFPSSNIGGSLEMDQFGDTVSRLAAAIRRPVIVAETAYPSTRDFKGQFSRWKYEVLGYPLTPDGQRRWVADFLAFCDSHPDISAVYYWSPEWYGEGMWKAFAFFDPLGAAKPAWSAVAGPAYAGRALKRPVYVEAVSNQLFVVPVEEAKAKMIPLIRELRERTGGVTVEHIALLTNTILEAGPYRVDLKGSLSQNLNLVLEPGHPGIPLAGDRPDLEAKLAVLAATVDPARDHLVLIDRGAPTPGIERAVAFFEQRGIEVVVHPKPEALPLKFGMCGAFGAVADNNDP